MTGYAIKTWRGPALAVAARQKIWRLHCQSVSTRAIAIRFGVSSPTILTVVAEQREAAREQAQTASGA